MSQFLMRSRCADFYLGLLTARSKQLTDQLNAADAVLVDYAPNDATIPQAQIIKNNEVIIRLLLTLTSRPYVLYMSTSWIGGGWGSCTSCSKPNSESHMCTSAAGQFVSKVPLKVCLKQMAPVKSANTAEDAHLKLARHYGIPHMSMLTAFGPIPPTSESGKEFWAKYYGGDQVHPTHGFGQRMIAGVVAHRMIEQMFIDVAANGSQAAASALWVSEEAKQIWNRYQAEGATEQDQFDLTTDALIRKRVILVRGFGFEVENQRKPGYIGHNVGDLMVLPLPEKTYRLVVGTLHSYAHNGIVQLRVLQAVRRVPTCDSCQCTVNKLAGRCQGTDDHCQVLANQTSDTLWEQGVSLRVGIEVQLRVPIGQCAWLEAEVLSALDRSENKVKLLDITAVKLAQLPNDSAKSTIVELPKWQQDALKKVADEGGMKGWSKEGR